MGLFVILQVAGWSCAAAPFARPLVPLQVLACTDDFEGSPLFLFSTPGVEPQVPKLLSAPEPQGPECVVCLFSWLLLRLLAEHAVRYDL